MHSDLLRLSVFRGTVYYCSNVHLFKNVEIIQILLNFKVLYQMTVIVFRKPALKQSISHTD